jgi:hypothetical protein
MNATSSSLVPWAGIISGTALHSLATLRLHPGLEAALDGDWVWVRQLHPTDKEAELLMNHVPWQEKYEILPNNQLRTAGSLLPIRRIPKLKWEPLGSLLSPKLSTPMLPGRPVDLLPHPVTKTPRQAQVPNHLLVTSAVWLRYAETAPQIRLRPLRFAQAARRVCLLQGTPLPPLPGQYYYLQNQVLWPAGTSPSDFGALFPWAHFLKLAPQEVALIHLNGTYEVIPSTAWVEASRSSARLSVDPKRYG